MELLVCKFVKGAVWFEYKEARDQGRLSSIPGLMRVEVVGFSLGFGTAGCSSCCHGLLSGLADNYGKC